MTKQQVINRMNLEQKKCHPDVLDNCPCDTCMGACMDDGGTYLYGGACGECFACEEIADNEKFWQVNRADILGL